MVSSKATEERRHEGAARQADNERFVQVGKDVSAAMLTTTKRPKPIGLQSLLILGKAVVNIHQLSSIMAPSVTIKQRRSPILYAPYLFLVGCVLKRELI